MIRWLGDRPRHPELDRRLPDRLLLAPPGKILLPKAFDKAALDQKAEEAVNAGGGEAAETEIPLLTR